MSSSIRLLVVALSVTVAGCGSGGATATTSSTTTPAPTTVTTVTTVTTTTPPPTAVLDWDDPGAVVTLGDWSVARCEGEAPLLCVSRGGDLQGVVEWFIADPYGYSTFDPDRDDLANLRAIAGDFVSTFEDDRRIGCGPDYVVEPWEPSEVELGGSPGLAYGFGGTMGDGRPSELNLQYATLSHERLVLIVAAAYDEGGCPGEDDLVSFDSRTLEEFRPHLEALLGASPPVGGDPDTGLALPDGQVFAWVAAVEGGLVVDPARVLSGEEARLQAVADGVLAEGEDLPNDSYVHNPSAVTYRVREASDVRWTVLAPGPSGALASRETDRSTLARALAGGDTGDVYGLTPDFMPFDLSVVGGTVVAVDQRYFP